MALLRVGRFQPRHSGFELAGKLQERVAHERALLSFGHVSVARCPGAVFRNELVRSNRDRLAQKDGYEALTISLG
jgi:hypothetical protein